MKVMVVGADGKLAGEIIRQWCARHQIAKYEFRDLDISRLEDVREAVGVVKPDVVLNGAAYNLVDDAETHVEDAYRANVLGPRNIAIAADEAGATLVHFSTDFVFDGKATRPYVEYNPVGPLGVYARSKVAGEQAVREHTNRFILVRVAWLIGHGGGNFVETMLKVGKERPAPHRRGRSGGHADLLRRRRPRAGATRRRPDVRALAHDGTRRVLMERLRAGDLPPGGNGGRGRPDIDGGTRTARGATGLQRAPEPHARTLDRRFHAPVGGIARDVSRGSPMMQWHMSRDIR